MTDFEKLIDDMSTYTYDEIVSNLTSLEKVYLNTEDKKLSKLNILLHELESRYKSHENFIVDFSVSEVYSSILKLFKDYQDEMISYIKRLSSKKLVSVIDYGEELFKLKIKYKEVVENMLTEIQYNILSKIYKGQGCSAWFNEDLVDIMTN